MGKPPRKLPKPQPDELEEGVDAIAEAAAVASGLDLSDRTDMNKVNRLMRRDELDGHVHRILSVSVYVVGGFALLMFGSLAWSMAFPATAPLNDEQLARLQGFLFSGIVGSGLTVAAKKVFGSEADD